MRRSYRKNLVRLFAVLSCFGTEASLAASCDALISALQDDRVSDAKAAIRAGCDTDSRLDGSGATPLMWARSRAMGEALLAAGGLTGQAGRLWQQCAAGRGRQGRYRLHAPSDRCRSPSRHRGPPYLRPVV